MKTFSFSKQLATSEVSVCGATVVKFLSVDLYHAKL